MRLSENREELSSVNSKEALPIIIGQELIKETAWSAIFSDRALEASNAPKSWKAALENGLGGRLQKRHATQKDSGG